MYLSNADEAWQKLSFEDLRPDAVYEISNYGQLRIYDSKTKDWKALKPIGKEYLYYTSFKSVYGWKKRITKPIHRLVAQYFLDAPKDVLEKFVIHKDYNKKNNYYKNLAWVNQAGLTQHNLNNPKVIAGKVKNRGNITNSKLTESDVRRLKLKLSRNKNRLNKLAKEFGITHTQLNRIRSGENWSHVEID